MEIATGRDEGSHCPSALQLIFVYHKSKMSWAFKSGPPAFENRPSKPGAVLFDEAELGTQGVFRTLAL